MEKKTTKATTKAAKTTTKASEKPSLEMVQNAISMGMDAVKAVHASVAEIEAFHATEEKRLISIAKQEKAKQEKEKKLLESLEKLQQQHSGFSMSEKMASAIISEYLYAGNALPESGQRQEYKNAVEGFLARVYGEEKKSWDGNRALLASGGFAMARLIIHLLQDGTLTEKMLKDSTLSFTGSKMKRK